MTHEGKKNVQFWIDEDFPLDGLEAREFFVGLTLLIDFVEWEPAAAMFHKRMKSWVKIWDKVKKYADEIQEEA